MAREAVISSHTNHRGEVLRVMAWPAAEPSKTIVVIHHGLGEHIGRYESVVEQLSSLPVDVYGYDAVGHGLSGGKRGDAAGIDGLAEELRSMIGVFIERSGAERVLVFGHSMGAAVVARSLTLGAPHPAIAAVVLSAPPIEIHRTPMIDLKITFGRVLAKLVPRVTLSNEIDHDNISSVPSEVERYAADPLIHDRVSLRLAASLIDDASTLPDKVGSVMLPLFLYQGLEDGVVMIEGTRRLAQSWGGPVRLEEVATGRHETHHERPETVAALFTTLREWLAPYVEA